LSFEVLMRSRSAAEYADFVLPSIDGGDRIIDVGCGPGSITVGLAQVGGPCDRRRCRRGRVHRCSGVLSEAWHRQRGVLEGSIYELDFPDASFDVCTLFSMMER